MKIREILMYRVNDLKMVNEKKYSCIAGLSEECTFNENNYMNYLVCAKELADILEVYWPQINSIEDIDNSIIAKSIILYKDKLRKLEGISEHRKQNKFIYMISLINKVFPIEIKSRQGNNIAMKAMV
ncbi:MAG: hypothetical protein N2645_02520 [Clostridia bacterium]|nr:hypothetical protein [Clostridia bacterium]